MTNNIKPSPEVLLVKQSRSQSVQPSCNLKVPGSRSGQIRYEHCTMHRSNVRGKVKAYRGRDTDKQIPRKVRSKSVDSVT